LPLLAYHAGVSTRTTGPGFLESLSGLTSYPQSVVETPRAAFALVADAFRRKQLAVVSDLPELLDAFHGARGRVERGGQSLPLKLCDLGAANAAALRASLDFLAPRPLGLGLSAGCGDRLGLATPGHIRAIRRSSMRPILAQQSMRENARTGRSPQQVVDDAMWGAFQEGWHDGFGADADHLKGRDDIDRCVAAGYTLYTIDPSEHVDNRANEAAAASLREALATLPWSELETSWQDTWTRLGRALDLGAFSFRPTEEQLLRAVVKYARVVAHTVALQRHLQHAMGGRPFELEMSVDESDTVTTLAEHVYIAAELKRLGVAWVSLAPRYVGDFEKGVDYRGDLWRRPWARTS
jgi:tagaturonate epimerase